MFSSRSHPSTSTSPESLHYPSRPPHSRDWTSGFLQLSKSWTKMRSWFLFLQPQVSTFLGEWQLFKNHCAGVWGHSGNNHLLHPNTHGRKGWTNLANMVAFILGQNVKVLGEWGLNTSLPWSPCSLSSTPLILPNWRWLSQVRQRGEWGRCVWVVRSYQILVPSPRIFLLFLHQCWPSS